MTTVELIEKLQALEEQYPGRDVLIDVGSYDDENTHQDIRTVAAATICEVDDYDKEFEVLALGIG